MKNTHLISLLILCFANHALHGQTITTIAGNGTAAYLGNGGPAISAQVQAPARICTDTFGNIYFLDLLNSAVREIDVTGNINTIAGSATSGYSGDGGPAADAQLNYPFGIACDLTGNIYIADQYNHRIRKIDASSGLITTIAGNGIPGFSGDDSVATNAKLKVPASVALDDSGNIYIADQYNNRVRKVSVSNNIITTIAGTGIAGALGDGSLAVSAQLDSPVSVAVDHSYNVYIADYKNAKVRKIDAATKNISTFAGTGVYGYSGDHGLAANAKLELPFDLQTDIHSNLYIIDEGASVIRSVNLLTDTIVTIAGTGACTIGFSHEGQWAGGHMGYRFRFSFLQQISDSQGPKGTNDSAAFGFLLPPSPYLTSPHLTSPHLHSESHSTQVRSAPLAHTLAHTHTHACPRAHTHTCPRTHTRMDAHTRACALMHTHSHIHTILHTRTCTHTHSLSLSHTHSHSL